ncbi:MAG: PP2C family protein-serine/threonine phosphatase [Vicinamibacteria bacterium]
MTTAVATSLHGLLGKLERPLSGAQRLEALIEEVFHALRVDLRLASVGMYAERRDGFELVQRVGGEALKDQVAGTNSSLRLVLQHGVYIFGCPEEAEPPWSEGVIRAAAPAAAVAIGRRPHRRVLFFLLEDDWSREAVDFALNVLRTGLGLQLLEERARQGTRQVTEIQESLLREPPPALAGFDIASRSIPADEVGGDFCDFVTRTREMLGFAIGDACGHGLPAALLVRDVVTGLRMGIEKHLRVEYVFGKLNRVIHRSNLSSRYVSAFYGELESNGNLSYINAGHQPPLLFRSDRILELRAGGTVIGPLPNARFRRGIIRMDPGDALVLVTDGIVERRDAHGEMLGEERLKKLVQDNLGAPAQALLDRLIDSAAAFGDGKPWEDDVTVMVARRRDD